MRWITIHSFALVAQLKHSTSHQGLAFWNGQLFCAFESNKGRFVFEWTSLKLTQYSMTILVLVRSSDLIALLEVGTSRPRSFARDDRNHWSYTCTIASILTVKIAFSCTQCRLHLSFNCFLWFMCGHHRSLSSCHTPAWSCGS